MQPSILFARQPIFDREMHVCAYELLCRSGQHRNPGEDAQDRASSEVLLNAFSSVDICQVVGHRKAFVNFTENLLHVSPLFGSRHLVVEVLESVIANERALGAMKQLRASGYTIALDDFELSSESEPLLAHADIVKLDVLALNEERLASHVEALRPYRVKLLAEKIETYEVLERCRGLGFDYFQGYFLSKPRDFAGRKIRENRVTLMQLLAKIHNPNIEFREIERLIKQDPVISFKLLRLINSAAFNLVRKIRSLKEAITMLGIDQIRRWATLLSLHEGTDKPLELSATTLTRAQMCYLIAQKVCPHDAESCFTVGLFSTLDAFLDAPIKKVLAELPLSKELVDAIVYRTGGAGRILDNVVAHEEARWEDIDLRGWPRFNEAELALAYRRSIEWVAQTAITAAPGESGKPVDPSDSACEALVPVVPDTDAARDPDRERKQSESVLQTAPGP